jgi:hypothetical protein
MNMLESTNLSVQEVQDNIDTYGKEFLIGDLSEYANAFKQDNK